MFILDIGLAKSSDQAKTKPQQGIDKYFKISHEGMVSRQKKLRALTGLNSPDHDTTIVLLAFDILAICNLA